MLLADLHIHSRYSRATSRDGNPEMLELWARRKGLSLIGAGDFTHPAWREELLQKLEPAEDGLYCLRSEFRLPDAPEGVKPRFVVSGEISSIYKKDGRVRKVHSLILLPGFSEAAALSLRLEAIGRIAGTCWKSPWMSARKRSLSRPTFGHPIFHCSELFPALIRLKSVSATLPRTLPRWKPAYLLTRP